MGGKYIFIRKTNEEVETGEEEVMFTISDLNHLFHLTKNYTDFGTVSDLNAVLEYVDICCIKFKVKSSTISSFHVRNKLETMSGKTY